MRIEETDLVVVGAGVAGMALAVEAFRRGFRTRVLERDPRGAAALAGRAALFHSPALDHLARLGLYDTLRTEGAVIERIRVLDAGSDAPALTLDLAELGGPFPHALAVPADTFHAACRDTFAKFKAVAVDEPVEMLSLYHERGRVAGALARAADGDVTYRAKVIGVTTASGGAPIRAEVGAATRSRSYPEEHAALVLARPEGWGAEAALWMGSGISVLAYPVTARRLRVEALAAGGILAGAKAAGTDGLRRLLAPTAPRLAAAIESLRSADDVVLGTATASRVKTWVGEAVALTGPAARATSPWGLGGDTQAVLDAAVLAAVLSRSFFSGDVSRLALAAYEKARRPAAERVAALADDLHRASVARAGLHGRARRAAPARLAASEPLRRKLLRTLAGPADEPLTTADRLRLAGLLPLPA